MRCLVALAISLAACGRDHGTPQVRPPPALDNFSALRGNGAPRSPRIANYKIDVTLDPTSHQLTATETLTWTNTGTQPVTELPFHLYLNAFKNENSAFMRSSRGEMRGARAADNNWGWIQLDSVTVGGAEMVGKLQWPRDRARTKNEPPDLDESVVWLPATVEPAQSIDVSFKFTAQLPEVFARTGYKGEFHMVGQWFPKIGVLVGSPGAEHWECRPFSLNTEFFADFGVYDVSITVPNTYVVAATGVLKKIKDAPGNLRVFGYHAEDVHDFAFMADPYMEVMKDTATVENGPVEVRVVYRPEQEEFAKRHLAAAIGTIEKFSASFVPYPWPIMTVIDPPMDAWQGAGGMEYPTLVTTAGDSVFSRPGIHLPEFVTVHEVGHNWFQGMLASNEPLEAWLDEGVNEWADANAMNDLYGPATSAIDWLGWNAEMHQLRRVLSDDPSSLPSPIASAAYAFVDNDAYGNATYASTMRALHTLEQTVGPTKFAAAMKVYAKTWAFKHPTGRDLFETLSKELGQDLTWFFGPVFHGVGGLTLGIRTAGCRTVHDPRGVIGDGSERKIVGEAEAPDKGTFECEVVITNTGTIHVPVEIALIFEDGGSVTATWNDRGGETWFPIVEKRSSRLVEVWIDPKNKLSLDNPVKHHYRLEGDGSASLRAAAWFAAGTQTLMQIVGP